LTDHISYQSREDFSRAKQKAMFQSIIRLLGIEKNELLPFYDVKDLLKPRKESYLGMRTIPVEKIVGSEGRYYDFSHTFLPKKELLRSRWVNVNTAHLASVNLPPIRVFKLGGCYFVRDGNHRVSVARSQGVEFIDAEVVELDSEIQIDASMTTYDLRLKVLEYERRQFIKFIEEHSLSGIINLKMIRFSAPGRYQEAVNHMLVHKYYINQGKEEEISLQEAAKSWFVSVYAPIVGMIKREKILRRFPGRTPGDLYMWIVKHWDKLKRKYGQDFSLEEATLDYSSRYGKSLWRRILQLFRPKRR